MSRFRFLPRFLLLTALAVMTSVPAWAGARVSVNVGLWPVDYYHHGYYGPHGYYPRHIYAPYPYYAPRPRFVYAAPVYVAPPVQYVPAPVAPLPAPTAQCTQYNGDATIDGSGTPFYGRACVFTDGRWHIVP